MLTATSPTPLPASIDDYTLIARIRQGDREAFAVLYRRHVRAVHGYAAALLQACDDVEDLVQETFVTAWERLDGDAILDRSALPWLLTTARYKAYNRNRSRSKQAKHESTSPFENHQIGTAAADQPVLDAEVREALDAAVNELSEIDRTVYEICIVDGSTYAQAAEALRITSGAVRNRLARVRERLRRELTILKGHNR